jgi:S-adenosylmethionine-dependent methyltransferase
MLATARDRAMTAGLDVQFIRGGIEDLRELDPFDAVLCHFVVQYRDDLVEDVGRLVSATRPGGLLSVIAPNPASIVITRLLRQGPADALAELERDTARTVTFDHEVRKVPFADVERHLNSQGCEVVGRYGGRIANDLISDNALKHEPDYYADLGRLELALCDQEPLWRFGNFWQLVAQTPPGHADTPAERTTRVAPMSVPGATDSGDDSRPHDGPRHPVAGAACNTS